VHMDAVSKAQAIAAKIGMNAASVMSLPGMEQALGGGAAAVQAPAESGAVGTSMRRGQLLVHHVEEIEINDYPREARWRVTQRNTIARLCDFYGIAITNKGEYYPPGKVPNAALGEKKMCISVEATDESALQNCVAEIRRLLVEETGRLAAGGGGGGGGKKFKM
jgi:ATP-dependent RNA helicase DDX46/PRP5